MKRLSMSPINQVLRVFKLLAIIFSFLFYFFSALLVSLVYIFLKPVAKLRIVSHLIQLFTLCLIKIINIRIKVTGDKKFLPGTFFVANHLSYIDGFVLAALFPIIYVGKSELKKWPLIGLMSDFSGTFYIDRSRKNHIAEYIDKIASALKSGTNVLFFPEGTSSDGRNLLPFKAAFFEAPISAGSRIVPVSIIYTSINGEPVTEENKDSVYWYGDMTFADHFFRLLSFWKLDVEVKIHPVVDIGTKGDNALLRKRACEMAYEAIRGGVCLKES